MNNNNNKYFTSERSEHSKRNFVSPRGHVISSIYACFYPDTHIRFLKLRTGLFRNVFSPKNLTDGPHSIDKLKTSGL